MLTARRLVRLALAAWVMRWVVLEVAGQLGRHLPQGPPPKDYPRPPGHMPGPVDRRR